MGEIGGILLALGIFATIVVRIAKVPRKWFALTLSGIILGLLLSVFLTVPAGHRGVVLTFGKVSAIMGEGLNARVPIAQSVVRMSVKTRLFSVEATAASKDLQDVATSIGLNYRLEPEKVGEVYRTIGLDYIEVIAHPLIQETVKELTAKYNAEDMILKRAEVKNALALVLAERLKERGIVAEVINITNFDFSEAFTASIESKVVAIQRVLEAENKLRQIEVEARQAEQKAKGEAAAIIALAKGQAVANKVLSESLTPGILQYMFIQTIKSSDKVVTVPGNMTLTLPTP